MEEMEVNHVDDIHEKLTDMVGDRVKVKASTSMSSPARSSCSTPRAASISLPRSAISSRSINGDRSVPDSFRAGKD